MQTTKRLRILNAVRDRLASVRNSDGYFSDVGAHVLLDARDVDAEDTPCVRVYFEPAEVAQVKNVRQLVAQSITVIAYDQLLSQQSQVLGEQLLADIQTAVESSDKTLGGLLSNAVDGLQPESFETSLPKKGSDIVAARITYAVPYVRKSGDPEIA